MSRASERVFVAGAAGRIETVVDYPEGVAREGSYDDARGVALIAHPHPLYGGTLDNKVVQTLAAVFAELGYVALRPNFRGVGASEGAYDEGRGETDDLVEVARYARARYGDKPLVLAGFSFGAFVQTRVARCVSPERLVLVAPAVGRFAVETVPQNTVVIHGERDETVPLAAVLDWARPQDLPIVVVPGAEHFFHRRLAILKNIVRAYCGRAR